jgi:hypothetical protein
MFHLIEIDEQVVHLLFVKLGVDVPVIVGQTLLW